MTAHHTTIEVQLANVTLHQLAVLKGYDQQKDVLSALPQHMRQATLSEMYRGKASYPKARRLIATLLLKDVAAAHRERLLMKIIENSAMAQKLKGTTR